MILSLKFSLLTKGEDEEREVSGAVLREQGTAELWLEEPVPTGEAEGMQVHSAS